MDQHIFESFNEQAKKLYGPVLNLNKAMLRNAERLTEHSLQAVKTYAELGLNQLREVSHVEDPSTLSAFTAKQAELLNSLSKQVLDDAQRLTDLGNELRADVAKCMSEAYTQAASAEPVAEKPEKPAKGKAAA